MGQIKGVTFTGADDRTTAINIAAIASTAADLGIRCELAVLCSASRSGAPSYPSAKAVARIAALVQEHDLDFAVHLCGTPARSVALERRMPTLDREWHEALSLAVLHGRVQINLNVRETSDGLIDRSRDVHAFLVDHVRVGRWDDRYMSTRGKVSIASPLHTGPRLIGQWRELNRWPQVPGVAWLFDRSAGTGQAPGVWPMLPSGRLVGLAGGLGPSAPGEPGSPPCPLRSVVQYVLAAPGAEVWLDMQSRLRSSDDTFDPAACCKVLKALAAWSS